MSYLIRWSYTSRTARAAAADNEVGDDGGFAIIDRFGNGGESLLVISDFSSANIRREDSGGGGGGNHPSF